MRLFVSYASQDRTRVGDLALHLGQLGHQVFWDRELVAGSGYRARLEQEISAADRVIVLWTKGSVRSDWVKEEAEAARQAGKLLPVRFRVSPPFGFREIHTPDLPLLASSQDVVSAIGLPPAQAVSGPMPPPPNPNQPPAPTPGSGQAPSPGDWYQKRGLFSWATKPR
jgi:hypothetical protein